MNLNWATNYLEKVNNNEEWIQDFEENGLSAEECIFGWFLVSLNSAKIDFLKNNILNKVAEFSIENIQIIINCNSISLQDFDGSEFKCSIKDFNLILEEFISITKNA